MLSGSSTRRGRPARAGPSPLPHPSAEHQQRASPLSAPNTGRHERSREGSGIVSASSGTRHGAVSAGTHTRMRPWCHLKDVQKLCLENGEESWRREISQGRPNSIHVWQRQRAAIISAPDNMIDCKGLLHKTAPEFWSRPDCKVRNVALYKQTGI